MVIFLFFSNLKDLNIRSVGSQFFLFLSLRRFYSGIRLSRIGFLVIRSLRRLIRIIFRNIRIVLRLTCITLWSIRLSIWLGSIALRSIRIVCRPVCSIGCIICFIFRSI